MTRIIDPNAGAILSTRILHARRNRAFGRVEALVEIISKPRAGQPPRLQRVRTDTDATLDGRMRERLESSAIKLLSVPRKGRIRLVA